MAWFPKHHHVALHALFNYCVLGIIYVLYTVLIIHQVEARTVAYTCIMNTSIVRHNMHTRRWVVHLTTVPPSSIKGMNMSFRHAMHRCLSPLARCRTMSGPSTMFHAFDGSTLITYTLRQPSLHTTAIAAIPPADCWPRRTLLVQFQRWRRLNFKNRGEYQ